jgi:hypothetical protein
LSPAFSHTSKRSIGTYFDNHNGFETVSTLGVTLIDSLGTVLAFLTEGIKLVGICNELK